MVRRTQRKGHYAQSRTNHHVYKYKYSGKKTTESRKTGGHRTRWRTDGVNILHPTGTRLHRN